MTSAAGDLVRPSPPAGADVRSELERTSELLRLATSVGRVGIWTWDEATDIAWWDETMRELAGDLGDRDRSFVDWLAIVHPDDVEAVRRRGDHRFADGEGRHRIVRTDGTVRHVVTRGRRVPGGLVGVVVDVTEAQEDAERLRETLDAMTDAYFAIDRSWRIAAVNRQAEELLGQPAAELVGFDIWQRFPAAVGTAFERTRATMDDGQLVCFEELLASHERWLEVRTFPTAHGMVVYFRDVTERRAAEAEREALLRAERVARLHAESAQAALLHQATRDPLTGLANRTELVRVLDERCTAGLPVSVLFLDLDRFKFVNDALGHAAGDEVLHAIARRLRRVCREGDVVARLGGDEFVIALPNDTRDVLERVSARVLDEVRRPIPVGAQDLVTTASIGICVATRDADAGSLLRDADIALYRAKDAGRDAIAYFDERAREEILDRVLLEHDLRAALEADELALHYQPTYDLATGEAVGVEGLLRWQHPDRGAVSPGAFIPVAEESGIILPLGGWVIDRAARDGRDWVSSAPGFTVWANVSARQLARPGLADDLAERLRAAGLEARHFGIEVTESVLADRGTVVRELERIAALGVKVAIDDFGTGYSSIARLRELPVDVLKIDRSFLADLPTVAGQRTLAAIIELAHAVGATTIAEGVETEEQLRALHELGCDAAAGFLLARPVPARDLPETVAAGARTLAAGIAPRPR